MTARALRSTAVRVQALRAEAEAEELEAEIVVLVEAMAPELPRLTAWVRSARVRSW
ncbi:hypothetical protein [Streptomyces sp. SLBN-118]|uniref:hypothetical protein n=1 Tax=Streptomyces sp. SLBN-118 TaxID=2768454 RepID=UPI0021B22230|nr:hypothetical protein [Streptomyces sp. SLBN-118]